MTTQEEYELDEPGFFWWRDEVYPDEQFAPDNMVAGRIQATLAYIRKIGPYVSVRDGMSGYAREGAEQSIVIFEHIGLIATCGLMIHSIDDRISENPAVSVIANMLETLLRNMPEAASPRLDDNSIDVALAMLFLQKANRRTSAKEWLGELCRRLDFTYRRRTNFPISTDSLDDLVEFTVAPDANMEQRLMAASWYTATLATWCVVLGNDEDYRILADGIAHHYPGVVPQFWHPDSDSLNLWYFKSVYETTGAVEAPFNLPIETSAIILRIRDFLSYSQWNILKKSSAVRAKFDGLNMLACRHYRNPIPARTWYELLRHDPE